MRLIRSLLGACFACIAAGSAAETVTVPPELWDRPRSYRAVLEQPAVKQAVSAYLARPGARLIIHHAAGQEPQLQAEELRAWLAALAVEVMAAGLTKLFPALA